VRRSIGAQFPRWADLPIRPAEFDGWDNRTFHLGDEMCVRMPTCEAYTSQVDKEHHRLPRLAPRWNSKPRRGARGAPEEASEATESPRGSGFMAQQRAAPGSPDPALLFRAPGAGKALNPMGR
jgi:aminoglycoside phosphotransferase (APT) family kinase protein